MKLGEKIKLVRKQRGMTQRELGERLHLDGNAANRIAQYELSLIHICKQTATKSCARQWMTLPVSDICKNKEIPSV